MVEDEERPTPPVVTGAVSIGTAPLPFLAVYAALFLLHGSLRPVHPADITSSQHGELLAGAIALVLFIVATTSLVWFLNRSRRWVFAIVQLAVLGACIDFIVDQTRGGTGVAVLLVLTSIVSLFLGFAPDGWTHVGRQPPGLVRRVYAVVGLAGRSEPDESTSGLAGSSPPSLVEPASLRRRRSRSS